MRYEFSFKVTGLTEEGIQRIIDRVSELVPAESLSVEVRGERLRVVITGPSRPPNSVRLSLRRALSEAVPPRGYRTKMSVREVVGNPSTPADLVAEALRMSGYDSRAEDDYVVTQAPRPVAEEAARKAAAAWREVLKQGQLSGAARKALTLASLITSRSLAELLESGVRAGVLIRQENNKILTAFDWRTAAEKLRRMVSLGGGAQDS